MRHLENTRRMVLFTLLSILAFTGAGCDGCGHDDDDDVDLPRIESPLPEPGTIQGFETLETDQALVEEDTNNTTDVYRKNLFTEEYSLVSMTPEGVSGDGPSHLGGSFPEDYEEETNQNRTWKNARKPKMSQDGRFVTFCSTATNLVQANVSQNVQGMYSYYDPNPLGESDQIYLRDLQENTTILISQNKGLEADQECSSPMIDPAGEWIAFESGASNLGNVMDPGGKTQVLFWKKPTGAVQTVSQGYETDPATSPCSGTRLSEDDFSLEFETKATNLDITKKTGGDTFAFLLSDL